MKIHVPISAAFNRPPMWNPNRTREAPDIIELQPGPQMRAAEESGRASMADIRRAIGVLGPRGSTPPLPGGGEIAALVEDMCAAGLAVSLSIEGEPDRIAPAPGLALYRIAQESLANVARHAPNEQVKITLVVRDGWAQLTVKNPRSVTRTGTGLGLAGMHERAAMVGGRCDAAGHGAEWVVRAEIPIGAPS